MRRFFGKVYGRVRAALSWRPTPRQVFYATNGTALLIACALWIALFLCGLYVCFKGLPPDLLATLQGRG